MKRHSQRSRPKIFYDVLDYLNQNGKPQRLTWVMRHANLYQSYMKGKGYLRHLQNKGMIRIQKLGIRKTLVSITEEGRQNLALLEKLDEKEML